MKLYFETYGCTMNRGDTELMMGLAAQQHELVSTLDECEVAVINSCGVIEFTERKILRRIKEIKRMNKMVLLAGCLPKISSMVTETSGADAVLGARNQNLINEALERLQRGEKFFNVSGDGLDKTLAPKIRMQSTIAIVPISEGCLGKCTYCATRFARGKLKSFSIESIAGEVKEAVAHGSKEIQLTAQDTGVYGLDSGCRLPELLKHICEIDSNFRVRVGMMNPEFVLEILDELIEAYCDEKIYKFLHLPVQSGSDEVLAHMQRGYSVRDFVSIVDAFRKNLKDVTISTDVIVGYPIEDEEAFSATYKLIERVRPDVLNITRFSPRSKTPAAELRDMPHWVKKERSRKLTSLHRRISREMNQKFVERELEVLITECGKNNTLLGRTNAYKQVVLSKGELGEFQKVSIRGATPSYLIAE